MRILTGVALAVALIAVGGGSSHAAAPPQVAWKTAASPFRLVFSTGGRTIASEADRVSGQNARLGYGLGDGTFHAVTSLLGSHAVSGGTEYRVATDEAGRTATVDVVRTDTGARVSMTLDPPSGVTTTYEDFAAGANEQFMGGGERPQPLDLRNGALAIKAWQSCHETMPAPFYMSSAGYGISLRTSAVASMAFPGATVQGICSGGNEPPCPLTSGLATVQLCAKSPSLSYDLFAGTPGQIVSAYTATIGRPLLPPTDQFELIKWRDVVTGAAQVLEDADELRALDIPIGWVELDNPWETGACYGSETFDPTQFPDPAGMISDLHKRNVKLMLWVSPLVRKDFCPPSTLYAQSALFPGSSASTIDLTDPSTLATFKSRLQALIAMGVDGFKADRGEEIDLEGSNLAAGPGVILGNTYPLLYAKAIADVIAKSGKQSTFATIFRSGAPGSAATVPGFWAGDQEGTFAGLRDAIHDGLSAGAAGYTTWGSDTGGYGPTQSAEVFVRWAQFSAVTPVFEVGGSGENGTFWDWGEPTISRFRAAAVLHYELFPYLYDLTRAAHTTGIPVLRPLALEYPNDPQAWQQDLEVLVGPSLLEAPVTVAAPAQPTVYLPAGRWLDLDTGKPVNGAGAPFTRATPPDQTPLYLKGGRAIQFAAREPQIWAKPWPVDALQMSGRGGWLYAPGRAAISTASHDFGTFAAKSVGRTVMISLTRAPAQTQLLVAGVNAPVSVRIDGKTVKSRSIAALRSAATGWAATTIPFPGTVLKLAPHKGKTTVQLVLRNPA